MTLNRFRNIILLLVITALSALAVILNLPSIPKKITGSFEYVRKGEALLDKGRYIQAIRYFERAHESSPGNEIISSDLVYAYSMYGRALSDQNKFDDAIDYLHKAYNVAPDAHTIQNLAACYSEKALHETKKGFGPEARNDYLMVRQYASMSGEAARNIGIILYNEGAEEYRSGKEEIALACMKESAAVCRDPRALEFIGDIYYKKAQFKRARYYWHAAARLNPGNAVLSKKLAKVEKELALYSDEKEANIPHFEIRYVKDLPLDKEFVSKTLEKAYQDIGGDLDYYPAASTKVFFYSKKDFKKTFNMPYFVKAFYDGSIKMPAPETALDKDVLARYIYHEYTHAIVCAKTANNCPAWLSEGVAVWEEYKRDSVDMRKVTGSIKRIPEISFRFLDESFKTDEISHDKALCYVLGYTLVDFVMDGWGMPALRGVLKRLANKQHVVNAIDDELLISESEFEKRWRRYISEKFF